MFARWIRQIVFKRTLRFQGLSENIGEAMRERRKQEDVEWFFYPAEVANRKSTVSAWFATESRPAVNTVMRIRFRA